MEFIFYIYYIYIRIYEYENQTLQKTLYVNFNETNILNYL